MDQINTNRTWTMAEAKTRLSELLRLAEEEGPQRINAERSFVVVPAETWYARITTPKIKVSIEDVEALKAVPPAALSAYARANGWVKGEAYGDYSDIYTADGLPEIILPRTQQLGDYANVVSRLIEIFARVADMDELTLYHRLIAARRQESPGRGERRNNAVPSE